eukprot:6189012-Pleurochrysis_carterae.AAC.1
MYLACCAPIDEGGGVGDRVAEQTRGPSAAMLRGDSCREVKFILAVLVKFILAVLVKFILAVLVLWIVLIHRARRKDSAVEGNSSK